MISSFKYSGKNVVETKNHQIHLKFHHKRLEEIKSKELQIVRSSSMIRLKPRKQFICGKEYAERELNIENSRFLEKLIKIGEFKCNFSRRSLTPTPGTLNSIIRKREALKIFEENQRIVNRILNKSPVLCKKNMEKDYEFYSQCKHRISRQLSSKRRINNCIRSIGGFSSIELINSHSKCKLLGLG